MTAPRRILSTSSAGRALGIVETLLLDAALKSERGVAYTRLLLGGVMVIVWPILAYEDLAAGRPSTWASFVGAAAAIVTALGLLAYLRRRTLTVYVQAFSVTADVLLIATVLLPYPFYPGPLYDTATTLSGCALLLLGIATGGARLSLRIALYATGAYLALLWSLAAIDHHLGHGTALVSDYTVYSIYLLAAGALAYFAASRTRELVMRAATETLQHERARGLLGAYVSEEVAIASLAADELRLGGERREVAVLFSDLRGFTAYSEELAPEELVRQLNRYLEVMVECVGAHGGVVDKYIGDAIMAVFGAPVSREDDAARAIRAAAAMRRALAAHNRDRERRGQPPLTQGIGVHFGPVVAGNVGTAARAAYTVIGDAVNLASRLESATKSEGVDVLLSAAVVEAARKHQGQKDLPELVEHGTITVRGRAGAVAVYTLA